MARRRPSKKLWNSCIQPEQRSHQYGTRHRVIKPGAKALCKAGSYLEYPVLIYRIALS
jgi:hypothetical protein